FSLNADDGHPATISFNVSLSDWNGADRWQAQVFKQGDSSNPVATLSNQSGTGVQQITGITESGNYYVRFTAFDNSSGSSRADMSVSNLRFNAHGYTPQSSQTVN